MAAQYRGHIRSFHLLRAVARRFDLRVIAGVDTADHPRLAVMRDQGMTVLPAVTGPRRPVAEAARAARATPGGEPYVMFHRHNRSAMRRTITQALTDAPPDLVYLDHLDPCAFRPLFPQARILVDCTAGSPSGWPRNARGSLVGIWPARLGCSAAWKPERRVMLERSWPCRRRKPGSSGCCWSDGISANRRATPPHRR